MFLEDDEMEYKLTAPYVDLLLRYFDRNSLMNPCLSSGQLLAAFEKMWTMLAPLAPLKKNDEAKTIWIQLPKGTIEDYGSCNYTFDEAREEEIVETYEDYENGWRQEYPGDLVWYAVTAVKSFNQDGSLRYYGLQIGYQAVISAVTEDHTFDNSEYYPEEAAIKLCDLILPSVQQSVNLLKEGKYNDLVEAELPYQFRTGVIRRADMRAYDPEYKTSDYDGLSEDTLRKFKALVKSGANDKNRIGRIKAFTANDFFRACKLGYEAIGKDCEGFTLPELYMHYSDGRDEGLTGMGHGLNRGSGIDFDSSSAWDEWYEGKRGGGHPWEVVPGGNSTHMELYVISEKQELGIDLRFGKITQKELPV